MAKNAISADSLCLCRKLAKRLIGGYLSLYAYAFSYDEQNKKGSIDCSIPDSHQPRAIAIHMHIVSTQLTASYFHMNVCFCFEPVSGSSRPGITDPTTVCLSRDTA